jgi:hypothetical protein
MTPSAALELFFRLFALVGAALTAMRLYKFGLHRKFRVFFSYLIFWTVYASAFLVVPTTSHLYFYTWVFVRPVEWLFYVLLILELYGLMLARHKGLYTVGRWALCAGLAVSVVISSATLLPRLSSSATNSWLLPILYTVERGLVFSLVVFLLLMLVFLMRYPIQLTRNVVVHAALFSILFLSNTLGLLLFSILSVRVSRPVNVAMMGISAVCILLWLMLLNNRGEETTAKLPFIGPEREQRLVSQLNAINSTLLRATRNK